MGLTEKQRKFCEYYVDTGNASQAYRMAYSAEKMKPKVVNNRACELLANGGITVAINDIKRKVSLKTEVSREECIRQLSNIVKLNITDVVKIRGKKVTIKSVDDLPEEIRSCIASAKATLYGIEIKFYDKIEAIDRLSRMCGWDKPVEVNQNVKIVMGDG